MNTVKKPLLKQFKLKKKIIVKFEDYQIILKEKEGYLETGTSGTIPTVIKTI